MHTASFQEILYAGLTGRVFVQHADWRPIAIKTLAFSAVGGLLFGILEPESSAGLALLPATLLWSLHILCICATFFALVAMLAQLPLRHPLVAAVPLILLPVLMGGQSLVIDAGFGTIEDASRADAGWVSRYLSEVAAVAPGVTIAGVVLTYFLFRDALARLKADETQRDLTPTPDRQAPALWQMIDGLPAHLGNDIIRAQAHDHYVEVVTALGRAFVMKRFGDCVEALADCNGLRCHRSHWIAPSHVRRVIRSGSAYKCLMDNGDEALVSRRRYADLKERLPGLVKQHAVLVPERPPAEDLTAGGSRH